MVQHGTTPRHLDPSHNANTSDAVRLVGGINGIEMEEFTGASVSAERRGLGNELENAEELNRRTVRKLDLLLLPFLALLFLFNSLDRSNIGNAEVNTLSPGIAIADQHRLPTLRKT
jgi:hypothetical protein